MLRWLATLSIALSAPGIPAPSAPIAAEPQSSDAEEAYRFLAGLYAQEHWELTVKEAESFLRQYPKHAKVDLARYRLAGALFSLDRLNEARPHFQKLASLNPFEFREEVHLRLGQCERQAGRAEQAQRALRVARAGSKEYLHPHAAFLLGEIALEGGAYAEALGHYDDNLRLAPEADTAAASRRGIAWCTLRQEQFQKAVQACEAFQRAHPQHTFQSEITFVWGEALVGAGQARKGLAKLQSIQNGAFHDAALRSSGFALASLQDHRAAAEHFARLLQSYPDSPYAAEAQLHCGANWLQAGDARAAYRVLARPETTTDVELLYWRAKALAAMQANEQALATVTTALGHKPNDEQTARLQALRGEVLYAEGRHEEAADAFTSAESDYALHAAATAHLAAGRNREAQRTSQNLLRRYPDSPYKRHTLRTLGEALFAQEQYAEAQTHFVALYQDREGDAEARSHGLLRYGWCRYFQDDRSEAANAFDRLLTEFPDAPGAEEAAHMAGRCHFELEANEEAQARWRRYLQRYRDGAYVDEALLGLGRSGLGAEPWQTLLRERPNSPLADDALLELARWHEGREAWPEATTHYRQLVQNYAQSEHRDAARYGLAWSLHSSGDNAAAMPVLLEIADSEAPAQWQNAGAELLLWCAVQEGRLDVAERAWKTIAGREFPAERRFPHAHSYALALQEAGQGAQAWSLLRPFTDARQDREVQRIAWTEGVWIALDAKTLDEASSRLQAAQRLSDGEAPVAEASFFVGEALYEQSNWKAAAQRYTWAQGAAQSQVGDQAAYKLGFCYLQTEEFGKAAQAFAALTEGFPASPLWGEALYLQGEAWLRAGDPKSAIAPLKALREKRPQHAAMPKALFRLGQAYAQTEQPKAAQAALAEVVRKHPQFEAWAEAELLRGECLMALDRTKEARSAFDRVLAKDKGVLAARARLQIGQWHMQRDALEDALAEYLKVSLLYAHAEEVAEAMYRAGDCLEKRGDTEAARKQYGEAVKKHSKTEYGRKAKQRLAQIDR